MVSDTPRADRCAAHVVDKVGLELHIPSDRTDSGSDYTLTDHSIDIIRLVSASGEVAVDAVPNYEAVREYRWNDYTAFAVGIQAQTDSGADDDDTAPDPGEIMPPEWPDEISATTVGPPDDTASPDGSNERPLAHDADGLVWFDVDGLVETLKNERTEHQGYCERYEMDDSDRCYVHQPGPGAPDPIENAIEHGLHAQRSNFYQVLDDQDQRFIEALVDSWLDQSPYDRDNVAVVNELYRCAIEQLRAWAGIDEFVEDGERTGLVTEQEIVDDGEMYEIEDEHPANLPYSRLDRDIQAKLKSLGVYQDPDSKQAEATESLAQKLSGLADN